MKPWKNPTVIGLSVYYIMQVLSKTFRVRIQSDPSINYDKQYVCSFWHGKQLLPGLLMNSLQNTTQSVLVSPSRDGAIAATFLHKMGYEVLRGSSRSGNVKALQDLVKRVKKGHSIGTPCDGPLGPKFDVKPGMIYLAQKFGLEIIPIGSAFSRKWTFQKSWDNFEIPKPFSKVGFVLGQPFSIAADADLKEACAELSKRIHAAESAAQDLIND